MMQRARRVVVDASGLHTTKQNVSLLDPSVVGKQHCLFRSADQNLRLETKQSCHSAQGQPRSRYRFMTREHKRPILGSSSPLAGGSLRRISSSSRHSAGSVLLLVSGNPTSLR